jgi:RNA polymerase sigma-70 factor (ECF subfamily)
LSLDPTEPDAALLDRYLAGDRGGADVLFARYQRSLLEFLLRRLGDRELAEEALQETFLRLLERARLLAVHPRIEAWLFAVARNVAADVTRRRKGGAYPFTSLGSDGFEAGLEDREGLGPERDLQSRELNIVIVGSLRALSPAEREVFLLRTQAMLSFKEIATRLGAPLNTVLSRMHRALKRIRKDMRRAGWLPAGVTLRQDGGRG